MSVRARVRAKTATPSLNEAREERDALREEIAPKLARIRKLDRMIRSMHAVLGTRPDVPGASPTLGERLREVLRVDGRPMRPRDLLNALRADGVTVCGKTRRDQLKAIDITIRRSAEIERVDLGLYGLVEWRERESEGRRVA